MDSIQITTNSLHKQVENKPKRFDMAVNFFCCLKKENRYYLVAFYYNPAWNLYYPFYDDVNKTPLLKSSQANTYKELISEANNFFDINSKDKLNLAYKRFEELIGCACKVKRSKIYESFELKYSKTANLYTFYKFYNYIITCVEDLKLLLNPKKLTCKLFNLDDLDDSKLVGNAVEFCKKSINELKQNALIWE